MTAKTDPAIEQELRELYSTGAWTQRQLRDRFGIAIATVARIINDPSDDPRLDDRIERVRNRPKSSWMTKITDDQVDQVRRLYSTGAWTQTQLATLFGVSQRLIGWIMTGERRGPIADPELAERLKQAANSHKAIEKIPRPESWRLFVDGKLTADQVIQIALDEIDQPAGRQTSPQTPEIHALTRFL